MSDYCSYSLQLICSCSTAVESYLSVVVLIKLITKADYVITTHLQLPLDHNVNL